MFRFQNPFEYDPFSAYGGGSGHHRAQPANRRRYMGNPYEEVFGGYPSDYRSYLQQQEELRRQQLERRRREEELYLQEQEMLRQEQERRMKLKLERERERKQKIARANKAAITIQRAVRAYLAKVRAERARKRAELEDKASRRIVRVMRFVAAVREARRIADSLRKLRTIRSAIKQEFDAFKLRPCGYRNTLRFIDTIEKKIISLDSVPRHRSAFVQERRRAIITEAQSALQYADFVQKMLVRKAAIVQRATRRFLQAKNQVKLERAARIITRTLRAFPKLRSARALAAQLREIREQTRRLDELRTQYVQALKAASDKFAASSTSASETLDSMIKALRDRAEREMSVLSSQQ